MDIDEYDINEYVRRATELITNKKKIEKLFIKIIQEVDDMFLEEFLEQLLSCEVIIENRHLILMNHKVKIDIQVDKDGNFDFWVCPREDDE